MNLKKRREELEDEYEVIESLRWRNTRTGDTASIYGAVPYTSCEDEKDWVMEKVGYAISNKGTGTITGGYKTREAAEARRKEIIDYKVECYRRLMTVDAQSHDQREE